MPTFPIPVFVACVLAFASLRLWQQRGHANPLVLLLILCAVQSLIIALNQHYGVSAMRMVQPLVASLIPSAAWIAYRRRAFRTDLINALGPLTAIAAFFVAPQFLDVVLPGLFAIYGCLILLRPDSPDLDHHRGRSYRFGIQRCLDCGDRGCGLPRNPSLDHQRLFCREPSDHRCTELFAASADRC
jgi:hypothetical protein